MVNLTYKHHEGSQAERPAEVDTISSPTVYYLRKNIEQVTREDPQTGDEVTLWGYDEAELTPMEYATYVAEEAAAKTEYVAMMSDIDLEEV